MEETLVNEKFEEDVEVNIHQDKVVQSANEEKIHNENPDEDHMNNNNLFNYK